jgi:hypothetical protein
MAVNNMTRIIRITIAIIRARHIAVTPTPGGKRRSYYPFKRIKKLPRMKLHHMRAAVEPLKKPFPEASSIHETAFAIEPPLLIT